MSTTIESVLHETESSLLSRNSWPRPTFSAWTPYRPLAARPKPTCKATGARWPTAKAIFPK